MPFKRKGRSWGSPTQALLRMSQRVGSRNCMFATTAAYKVSIEVQRDVLTSNYMFTGIRAEISKVSCLNPLCVHPVAVLTTVYYTTGEYSLTA